MSTKTTNFLYDQIWKIIGVTTILLGIYAAYIIFFLQSSEENLDVPSLSYISVVSISPEVVDDIQISYEGEMAKDVYLLEFQLKNTGNRAFLSSRNKNPIIFSVNPDFIIFDSYAYWTNPPNIDFVITQLTSHEIKVSFAPLNPGNTVVIRAILINKNTANQKLGFQDAVRIVDLKQILRR